MVRHTRINRDLSDEDELDEDVHDTHEFRDENGIIHTTSRSLRKVNYAEVENKYAQTDEEPDNYSEMAEKIEKEDEENGEEDDDEDEDNIVAKNLAQRTQRRDSQTLTPEGTDSGSHEKVPTDDAQIEDDDDDEQIMPSRRRARSRSAVTEEDESFHEEDADEEEELEASDDEYQSEQSVKRHRRRADRSFIINDDDGDGGDTDEDHELRRNFRDSTLKARRGRRNERSPPRKLRRRTRSAYLNSDSDEEKLSLAEELNELQDDSPIREKRSLRERTKPVNYTIPPPLLDNTIDELGRPLNSMAPNSFQSPRGRRGLHAQQSFGPIRRLFPTGGPFGGNDVTAIFGTNTNFYSGGASNNGNNKLLIDSDSSDDEILPLGSASSKTKSAKPLKKKKPEIADLDPLGVDMNVKFEEVGGLDNYIDQLKEMVALPLLYPELYQNFGITPPRGVLFHGPPGTGKTLMARALAASCSTKERKITFFMRKGADILSKWVGEAERQLRLLFEEAKKQQPSIIFFDEIDGLAPVRSSKQEQIHASIVSTMLALMDGMDNRGQVIVIGATNRPDAVDPALRRPGRFDREFYFPLPDLKARIKILQIHTKKWKPPLNIDFLEKLASLTKGYGGADLRALCTEAALISIQRKLPQIYQSDLKLSVDPNSVTVKARDFMLALDKIVPSSARSTGNSAQPLPENIESLLIDQFDQVKQKIDSIMPRDSRTLQRGSSLIKHYLEYEDVCSDDDDNGGFVKAEFVKCLEKSRTCNPRLLVNGPFGNGQQYIGAAILHHLEDFNVQKLDLENLVSESSRTMESAVVQTFVEARRRQPSILYIPNANIWFQTVSESTILTLASLLRSLQSNEKVLLLAIAENFDDQELNKSALSYLGLSKSVIQIAKPSSEQRYKYFQSLKDFLRMKPTDFEKSRKRKQPLPKLPVVESRTNEELGTDGHPLSDDLKLIKELRSSQSQDMKLKNSLKIKLAGLMDLFKNRYKRFRKPPIDDSLLIHLFEPEAYPTTNFNGQSTYVKEGDMILEVATGKKFFNMDLDIVEERLWNGFYSEPKQFLKDIELIYHDAHTFGDRERVIKASEMFANAQMGIEEISTPEFVQECKETRKREILRQNLFLKEQANIQDKIEPEINNELSQPETQLIEDERKLSEEGSEVELGVGADHQLQVQVQHSNNNTNVLSPCLEVNESSSDVIRMDRLVEKTEQTLVDKDINERPTEIYQENSTVFPESHVIGLAGSTHDTSTNGNTQQKDSYRDPQNDLALKDSLDLSTHLSPKSQSPTSQSPTAQSPASQSPTAQPTTPDPPSPEPTFVMDEDRVERMIAHIQKSTTGYTVEKLENIYASALSLAWDDRFLWDKTSTVDKLSKML